MTSKWRARPESVGVLVVWWALLGGAWMLLADTVSVAEVSSAAVAAVLGVSVTCLVFRSEAARMRPPLSMCLALGLALGRQSMRVPADLWLLVLALARALAGHRRAGRFHELSLELATDARGNGRRAGIEIAGSLAPNTIVLGVDEQRVIVHQLVARHGERASIGEIGS